MNNFMIGFMVGICGGVALVGAIITQGIVPGANAELLTFGEFLLLVGLLLGGAMVLIVGSAVLGERMRRKALRPAKTIK